MGRQEPFPRRSPQKSGSPHSPTPTRLQADTHTQLPCSSPLCSVSGCFSGSVSDGVSGSVSDCVSECPWQGSECRGYFLTEHLAASLALSPAVFLGVRLFASISFSGISLPVCQAVSLAGFLTLSRACVADGFSDISACIWLSLVWCFWWVLDCVLAVLWPCLWLVIWLTYLFLWLVPHTVSPAWV